MLVVDLHCAEGHRFEGWFASADDLASQQGRGLLSCPVCGHHEVQRLPSAPRLNTGSLRETLPEPKRSARPLADGGTPAPGLRDTVQRPTSPPANPGPAHAALPPEAQEAMAALQALYLRAVREVVANTEDVGDRFASEVRSIHHGDAPERAIRGRASAEERAELADEGIEILSLPMPEGIDGPLQ